MEGEKYLRRLEVVGYKLEFIIESNNVFYYTCEIEGGTNQIEIIAEPSDERYHLNGDSGVLPVNKGINTFVLSVNENEELIKTFEISVVVKDNKSDASINRILVNNKKAEAVFEFNVLLHYYILLPKEQAFAEVEPIPNNINAEIRGDYGTVTVEPGLNNFLVEITSEDRRAQENYLLIIEREESKQHEVREIVINPSDESTKDSTEVLLEISAKEISEEDPEGILEEDPKGISEEIPEGISEKSLEEITELIMGKIPEDIPEDISEEIHHEKWAYNGMSDELREVPEWLDVNYMTGMNSENDIVEKSVEESERQDLPALEEEVEALHKRTDIVPKLKSLTISDGSLIPEFDPEVLDYTVELDDVVELIAIDAVAETNETVLDGDLGENELVSGDNLFYISCTLEDHSSTRVYKLHLNKKAAVPQTKDEDENRKKQYRKKQKSLKYKLLLVQIKSFFSSSNQKRMRTRDKVGAVLLLTASLTYLSYTFLAEPLKTKNNSVSQKLLEVSQRRATIDSYLQKKDQLQNGLKIYEDEIKAFAERYPNLPSQEEILGFLDYLNSRVTFDYISVTISNDEQVTLDDIRANAADKKLGELAGNIEEIVPPASEEGNLVTETRESGLTGDETIKEHLTMNTATIVVQGRYDDLLRLYSLIYDEKRNILMDNITFNLVNNTTLSDMTEVFWELSFDMIFYCYTNAAAVE